MDDEVAPPPADAWLPPWWLLAFAPLLWLLVGAAVLSQRNVIVAVVALVLLAPVGMPIPAVLRRLHHRRLIGAYLGPITFVVVTTLTPLPIWLCVASALCATLLGLIIATTRDFAHD